MSTDPPLEGATVTGVRNFYTEWAGSMTGEGLDAPDFDTLSGDAVIAWCLAYASTVEIGARMATAVHLTLEAEDTTP